MTDGNDQPGPAPRHPADFITAQTNVIVAAAVDPSPDRLILGSVTRPASGPITAARDETLYLAPARHAHAGTLSQGADGVWRPQRSFPLAG